MSPWVFGLLIAGALLHVALIWSRSWLLGVSAVMLVILGWAIGVLHERYAGRILRRGRHAQR